jgi:hypothetical protein
LKPRCTPCGRTCPTRIGKMQSAPPKPAWLVRLRKPPSGSGRSTRPIQRSLPLSPWWLLAYLPGPLVLLVSLLLQGCATAKPRYVVVSANRACSGVFEKFTKEQIEQATKEARVKMEGHNAAMIYCRKT